MARPSGPRFGSQILIALYPGSCALFASVPEFDEARRSWRLPGAHTGACGGETAADGCYTVDFQSVAPVIGDDGAVALTLVTEQTNPCY